MTRWLEIVPTDECPARLGRLLHERLTPTAIAAEPAEAELAAAEPTAAETPQRPNEPPCPASVSGST